MSEAHNWSWLEASAGSSYMTMESYLGLPEDVARTIEVTGGLIAHRESPSEAPLAVDAIDLFSVQVSWDTLDRGVV